MRSIHAAAFFATGYLAINANALPKPNPAATYSVVDVGGPSTTQAADPEETVVYATVTESSTPETVTQQATPSTVTEDITVTVASPSEPTATKSWTVTIGGTQVSVLTTTVSESVSQPTTEVVATNTVYYGVPPAPAPETTSAPCSTSSTSWKSAYPTAVSQWNSTISAIVRPTGTGSFSFKPSYASGTGAHWSRPLSTHGSGGHAAPTAWGPSSWNSTYTRFRSG